MSRNNRVESRYGIYHLMQRGAGKQIIFESDSDYKFYIKKLKEYKSIIDYELIAYCLMDNHIHLLVKTDEIENVSSLMHRLGTSYARYYNKKYEHFGHVFQARFRSVSIDTESYFLSCVKYIHNNPVKAGIASREKYPWSSYCDYLMGTGITDCSFLLNMVGGKSAFMKMSITSDNTEVVSFKDIMLTCDDARRIIGRELKLDCKDASILKILGKNERNRILRVLKSEGFSIRDIEHYTGINRNIVYRA